MRSLCQVQHLWLKNIALEENRNKSEDLKIKKLVSLKRKQLVKGVESHQEIAKMKKVPREWQKKKGVYLKKIDTLKNKKRIIKKKKHLNKFRRDKFHRKSHQNILQEQVLKEMLKKTTSKLNNQKIRFQRLKLSKSLKRK